MAFAISFVLLVNPAPFGHRELADSLRALWADSPPLSDGKDDGRTVSLSCGEFFLILGKMEAPYPWSDLEGPCATSILWRDATAEVPRHNEHWVITVHAEADPLDLATVLTWTTAAVLAACPAALGAYWGNARMVIPKDLFIDRTKEILPKGAPVYLWVDFRVGQESPGTATGFTCGLAALGLMELEAKKGPLSVGELRELLSNMADYLLENGPVIKDGDTVGGDEHERIRVLYADSVFGTEGQVMRLNWERV